MRPIFKRATIVFFIFLIIILGTYLRLLPFYNTDRAVHFKYDNAFHLRMILEVSERGNIPVVDNLSLYPDGRNIRAELPTLLYYAGAYFNKFLNIFKKGITPLTSTIYFSSIAGALIAVPVYFISIILLKNRRSALFSSLLSVLLLPYLVRTFCCRVRYDGLAALFLFASFYFLIKGIKDRNLYGNITYSFISGLMLISALAAWRVSLIFLLLYGIGIVLTLIAGANSLNIVRAYVIIFLTGFASFLFIPYLSLNMPLFSSVAAYSPGDILRIAFIKAAGVFGFHINITGFDYLLSEVEELRGLSVLAFLGREQFFLAGLFPFFYIGYLIKRKGFFSKDKNEAAVNILFTFFAAAMSILTLLFRRFQIMLAPLVAISTAGLFQYSLRDFLTSKGKRRILKILVPILIIAISIYMSCTSYVFMKHLGSVFDASTTESLKWINEHIPRKSAILTHWADGYIVQLYTGRPTVTDGLLENKQNKQRIIQTAEALYSFDPDELYVLCKKLGAGYILLPANRNKEYAITAGHQYSDYYNNQNQPTEKGLNTTLFKLLYFSSGKLDKFTLKYKNEKYCVYEVK